MVIAILPRRIGHAAVLGAVTVLSQALARTGNAQVTVADYDRATGLRERFEAPGMVTNAADAPVWLSSGKLLYRKSVPGGFSFVLVDPASPGKKAAFDHARLATVLSGALGQTYTPTTLPFSAFTFAEGEGAAV